MAWSCLSAKDRVAIRGCNQVPEAFMVKTLKELVAESLRMMNGDHRKALEMMAGFPAHVVWTGFARHGSEKVINGFRAWARAEFKKCPKTLRGKAAAPPFGYLKWLAAFRLEASRRKVSIKFQDVQKAVAEYQLRNPRQNHHDVLPLYASHGAWSKSISDAERLLEMHGADPMALCVKIFDPLSFEAYQTRRNEIKKG